MKNPLILKEFRQRMRTNRATFVVTFYVSAMTLFTFFLLYESIQGQLYAFQPARSQQVFFFLSLLQMGVVSFLTPAFSANAVSGERERRTLAILLTTPLAPMSILVGKILSSVALLALLLVVSLPLYSLVFVFGGAVPQEALGVFAFELFTIIVIATLSVLWSTIALRSGWSTVLSYGTVSFMVIVSGAIGLGIRYFVAQNPIESFLSRYSPWFLDLNPLWVLAALEHAVSASSHTWMVFVLFYVVVVLFLALPALWRLRPQYLRKVPFVNRLNERNYQ